MGYNLIFKLRMSIDFNTINLASATDVSTGKYVCNPKVDFDCNGKIESWEKVNDVPRVIFGAMGMIITALSLYSLLANDFIKHFGFSYYTWFSAGNATLFIFTCFTSFPQMLFWWLSYIDSLALIDIFYYLNFVNTWYLSSAFWLPVLFLLIHLDHRENGALGETAIDHSTTVLLTTLISGVTGLVLQILWADRMNLWYVKA